MASPQIENGYLRIATELYEALAGIRISGEARQCLDVIIRKTYGFNKKEDSIALSQFQIITKLGKVSICKALQKLANMGLIITKVGNENGKIYRFNKDFDAWKPLPKKVTVTKKGNQRYQKSKSALPKKVTTIDNTKDNITIDNKQPIGCEKLNPLINLFKGVNPNYERLFRNTTQREALDRLVKKFTYEKIENLLKALPGIVSQTYAPKITTPYELERDMGRLLLFVKGAQNKNFKNQVYKV